MNERPLADALRASVDTRPDTTGWAHSARRRAQRRRAGVAAAAVFAVVGIATPVALQLTEPPSVVVATPEAPADVSTVLVPDICADPLLDAEPLVNDDLPEGATRVWLCGRSDTGSALELVGAPDPLVARADEAVQAFNALEKSEGVLDCMPDPLDYRVVVEYPDGVRRALRIAGCGDLRDATAMFNVFRADGAGYLSQLRGLWSAERAETEYAFEGIEVCGSSYASVLRPLPHEMLTRSVVCRADGSTEELDDTLTDELVAALGSSESVGAEAALETVRPDVVLLTSTGDPISLMRLESGVYWWDEGADRRTLQLEPEVEARLIEAQGPPPTAPASPAEPALPSVEPGETLLAPVCEALRSGVIAPEALPASDALAEGPGRVWLCGDTLPSYPDVGPMEPLTVDPDRVVDLVNALPAAEADACTEMGGLTFHLVFEYAGGEQRVISAETVNCQFVGGPEGRTGGAELLDDILPLWQSQRDVSPVPMTHDVSVCSEEAATIGVRSMLPVDRASLYRGFVCGLPADGGDEWIQRELPGELLIALTQAEPTPDPSWPQPGYSPLDHPYVVAYNQFGDPVTYPVDGDGALRLEDGLWTPDGGLDAAWTDLLAGLRQ